MAKLLCIETYVPLPTGSPAAIPRIQHKFEPETDARKSARQIRLNTVRESFLHSWEGYKKHAWLQDEVTPLSGTYNNGFGGWGATLVDTLDTLWIMGLKKEFVVAVAALKKINFSSTTLDTVNVFETTIRYLGGFLSAYDISGGKYPALLEKAVELGEMLYVAFDTPNRMPVTRWDWKNAALRGPQEADSHALVAEIGSLSLEFTRLSQLSGDNKYYDAVQRISDVFEDQQNKTKIPGIWPVMLNAREGDFTRDRTFTFGGMADSLYEYLPKQHLLLGGRTDQNRRMYAGALTAAKQHIFYRPMNPNNKQILLAGTTQRNSANNIRLDPEGQHLACFAGGMVALAARVFDRPEDMETARQLVDGCIWAYESMPTGIMPESFHTVACTDHRDCEWDEMAWFKGVAEKQQHVLGGPKLAWEDVAQKYIKEMSLAPGFTDIGDRRYILRPEAIESLFILYRITGDTTLQDSAWKMFQAIDTHTKTDIAHAALDDVTNKQTSQADSMESFWTAETLKYFYLIFSEPDVVSLDEYVFNTEAHPLLRPKV
ncbi:hypothetical protein LTR50_005028 [Elasticomyces elasticus]|nr:hypothetical protein LTR50_005028 [Elasticomyces elasticus]